MLLIRLLEICAESRFAVARLAIVNIRFVRTQQPSAVEQTTLLNLETMLTGFIKKLGQEPADEQDEERLLKLYWNRAQLKKEFADLRKERFQLLDQLKQHEGTIHRVREQLTSLEKMLLDPGKAINAVVHFQLRALWQKCTQKLVQFSAELKGQQEHREKDRHRQQLLQERAEHINKLNNKAELIKIRSREILVEISALEEQAASMGGIWNWFRRKRMLHQIEEKNLGLAALRGDIEAIFRERAGIESETLPEYPGLSIDGRRLINIATIALAQHLVLHFADNSIASQARLANMQPAGSIDFGSRHDCDQMVLCIKQGLDSLDQENFAGALKARTDYLRPLVRYRKRDEAVPMAETADSIARDLTDGNQGRRTSDGPLAINVLTDEYWDIFSVLL